MDFEQWYRDAAWPEGDDPVLLCLAFLAKLHDRPASPARLKTGLALGGDGRLPFHQIEAALDHIGMRGEASRRTLAKWSPGRTPAILRMAQGRAAVLVAVRDGQGLIFAPGLPEPVWIEQAVLARYHEGEAIVVEPDPTRDREGERPWQKAARAHWFWSEVWKVRRAFLYVALAAVVVNLLAFAVPLFTMNVYDRIIPNRSAASLWVLALGVLLALGLDYILRLARAQLIDEVGRDLDARLAQKLFEKVINLPLSARRGSTGALARRVSDYEMVREFFASTTVVLAVDSLFLILFLGLITLLGGLLVLVPILGIILMGLAGLGLQKAMAQASIDAQADSSLQQSALVESIGGIETLKAVRGEGRMLGRWRRYSEMSAATQERFRRLTAISVNLASVCQQAITVGLIVGGFYLFNAGLMSMGAIIAIAMIASRALAPIGQFAFLMTRARQALLTLRTLQSLMEQPDERDMGARSVAPTVRAGAITLDHLGFKYPGAARNSLSEISLSIAPGERIGVIGRVASGKSTLGRLLCGLYQPTDGAMIVDGLDSRQYQPHELRGALRYVGQDAELFSGSVRDNLTLGAAGVDDDALIDAVRRAGADSFLARDAAGFDLPVGEHGSRLSGGQRSFLVLARALVDPSRLLFLDEPTGAMDTQSERAFITHLDSALAADQTLIVSTHRHAMLDIVRRLIVIDQGRIIADGPRDQVLSALADAAKARA